MYNKTLGTAKKLVFALAAVTVLTISGASVKANAEPLEETAAAEENHDETVSESAETVTAEAPAENYTEAAPAETVIPTETTETPAEVIIPTEAAEIYAAPAEGYTEAAPAEAVPAECYTEAVPAEAVIPTEATEVPAEAVIPTETTEENAEERQIVSYYDFGADEYAKRMEPLVTQDEEGRTIYINYLPTEDDKIVGWHQDGFKMMAVVEPCGTKGVIYLESNNLPDKIKIDSIGLTELKDIIKFEDNSYVKSIEFGKPKSFGILMFKDHAITVNSSGVNKWFYTQSMNFQDESGDVYGLGMMRYGEHEVSYDSDAPKIAVITWGY